MSLTHIQYVCYFIIVFLDVKMKELSFVYGYSKILIGFNKTYNISESDLSYEPLRLPESFSVVFIILHVLLTCLAIGGNILLIYIITTLPRRYKKGETSYNASAAASDILMNCICVPFTALSEMIFYWWPFGTVMCPCLQFLQMTCVVQKSFNMVALNYDQHYAVAKPMKTSSRSKLIRSLVALSWIFAAFVSIPTAIRSRVVNLEFLPEGEGLCLEVWNYRYQRQMYSIAIILFQYLVPVTLVTILSLHSGYLIWTNTIPGEKDHRRDKMITKSKKRVGVRVFCSLLFHLVGVYLFLHPRCRILQCSVILYFNLYKHGEYRHKFAGE